MTTLTVHAATVGVFVPMLQQLDKMLEKAEAFATAKKLEAGVIEGLRLAPDMFTLTRQVQIACDFAKNGAYRLAGIDPPKVPDDQKTLAELRGRIAHTLTLLAAITPDKLEGTEKRHLSVPLYGRTLEIDGLPFIQRWTLPNFFFHLTTVYALLRNAGVELGKQDFLGGV
mgnify:CR=1 FL=1|jgi:hypothetical protein